jgi:hypothetical protein
MPSRKEFVAAAAASVGALATPDASPAPTPSAAPTPSPAARAIASSMRAFDPHLTDAEVDEIATGIETNLRLGNTVNAKGRALKNSDEPIPSFAVNG